MCIASLICVHDNSGKFSIFIYRGFILNDALLTAAKGTVRIESEAISSARGFNCASGPDEDSEL